MVAQRANKQRDKVFCVNVVSDPDPLEIYTDREGEVIFKKYSPIGELTEFAAQYAETLHKTCNLSVVICDRDAVIASAGVPKKEFFDKALSAELENILNSRSLYVKSDDSEEYPIIEENRSHHISCAMPILTEGDLIGCVASVCLNGSAKSEMKPELEAKLIQTAAIFLGKQLES